MMTRLLLSIAAAGLLLTTAGCGTDEPETNQSAEHRLATPDPEQLAGPYATSLIESADGRWLAFIDREDKGEGAAEAVVVDLTTGEEVVRSKKGVGDSGSDADWEDLYEDAPVSILAVVDDTAYVHGTSTLETYDLLTGESTSSDLDWEAILASDWWPSE